MAVISIFVGSGLCLLGVRSLLYAFAYFLLRHALRLITGGPNELVSIEVEVVVLRHQLKVLKRQVGKPRLRRRDRLLMAAISRVFPRTRWSSFLVSPQTLLRWHRELVRRKWTFRRRRVGGRPPIPDAVRELILRMGKENPRWGCIRIRGELAKLGISVSATKIRTLLRANGLEPAPRRNGPTWSEFLRSQAQGILAFDFFTVETVMLRTVYVLFAVHVGSRRVHVLGVTRNPDSAWVTQQARNLAVGKRLRGIRFVIREHDSKFPGPFDQVFRSEGMRIVKTPIRAPRTNAYAERWSARSRLSAWTGCLCWAAGTWRECSVPTSSTTTRPGRIVASKLKTPERRPSQGRRPADVARVRTHDVLGGLIREYKFAA